MFKLFLIASGGAVGALLRFAVSGVVGRFAGGGFPSGTLAFNLLGCLLIGVVWGLSERVTLHANVYVFLLTGLLGAFTTFSTFGVETVNLFRAGELLYASAYVLASNAAGFLAVAAGMFIARTAA